MTPTDVVVTFLAACGSQDLDTAVSLVHDDLEYDNVPVGIVRGADAMRNVLSSGISALAEQTEWRLLRHAANDEVVMCERLDRFLVRGRWVEVPVAGVFVIRDGKIATWRDYFDLLSYRRQKDEATSAS